MARFRTQGIPNTTNSCWLISAIQLLVAHPQLPERLAELSRQHDSSLTPAQKNLVLFMQQWLQGNMPNEVIWKTFLTNFYKECQFIMGQPYDENEGYLYLVTLLGIASECSLQRIVHHDDGSSSLSSDSVAFLTLHGNIDLGDVFQPRVEMVGGKEHETFPTITELTDSLLFDVASSRNIKHPLSVPHSIQLLNDKGQTSVFILQAVSMRNSGHYISFRRLDNTWLCHNDKTLVQRDIKSMQRYCEKEQAYSPRTLCYVRSDLVQPQEVAIESPMAFNGGNLMTTLDLRQASSTANSLREIYVPYSEDISTTINPEENHVGEPSSTEGSSVEKPVPSCHDLDELFCNFQQIAIGSAFAASRDDSHQKRENLSLIFNQIEKYQDAMIQHAKTKIAAHKNEHQEVIESLRALSDLSDEEKLIIEEENNALLAQKVSLEEREIDEIRSLVSNCRLYL